MPKRPSPPLSAQRSAPRGSPTPPSQLSPTVTPLYASGGEWLAQSAPPAEILEQLLERPDVGRLVRATPAQPLFLFVRSLGLQEALDVLSLCSPEQVQAFVDMDGWDRDQASLDRVLPWLLALGELGPAKLTSVAAALDPELWTAILGPRLRVYDIYKNEEPPEQAEGQFFDTPDRMFRVDILPPPGPHSDGEDGRPVESFGDAGDSQAQIARLLDILYRGNAELARAIVHSAGYDVGPETAEAAYRFRSGRMADLGYIDYYEALKVYLLLDPEKPPPPSELQPLAAALSQSPPAAVHVLPGSDTVSGALLRTVPGLGADDCAFARGVALLSEPEQALLVQHLMVLGNRVLAADRVELGDVEALRQTLRRTVGYLSLGIEYRLRTRPAKSASSSDEADAATTAASSPAAQAATAALEAARAAEVLREISLLHLFRIGYGLTVQLRKLLLLLLSSSEGLLTPMRSATPPAAGNPAAIATRLPPRLGEPLSALLLVRPLYSPYLDRQAAERGTLPPAATQLRPFVSLADLGRATALVGELSTLSKLLSTGLGLRSEHITETLKRAVPDEAEAQLSDLVGTLIGNLLLGRPPALVPLSRQDLPSLRRAVWGDKLPPFPTPGQVAGPLPEPPAARITEVLASLRERVYSRSFGEAEFKALWVAESERFLRETLTTLAHSLAALPENLDGAQLDVVPRLAGLLLSR